MGNFPINQMILMMVNNKIKEEFEKRNRDNEDNNENEKREQRVRDLNQLLEQMSGKLPRSECDEYESNSESSDSEERYKNKK